MELAAVVPSMRADHVAVCRDSDAVGQPVVFVVTTTARCARPSPAILVVCRLHGYRARRSFCARVTISSGTTPTSTWPPLTGAREDGALTSSASSDRGVGAAKAARRHSRFRYDRSAPLSRIRLRPRSPDAYRALLLHITFEYRGATPRMIYRFMARPPRNAAGALHLNG